MYRSPEGLQLRGVMEWAGKSTICECLAGALTEMGSKHVIWRMNPKVRLRRMVDFDILKC